MRYRLAGAIGLAILFSSAVSAAPDERTFDGDWDVMLVCPKASGGALPFTFQFTAKISDSMFRGEHGAAHQPGWLLLTGHIGPNGDANLSAVGVTGQAAYNVNQTLRGVPYEHPVTAHLEAGHGAGSWTVPTRICRFSFERK